MAKGGKRHKRGFGISEYGVDVEEALQKYVEMLHKGPLKVRSIILFGSRARGNHKPWSDTDIIIIAENPSCKVDLNPAEVWGIGLEPKIYTPKEFIREIKEHDLTALDAIHEGINIYDDGFWDEARRVFKKVKREYKLKRIKGGWIALNWSISPLGRKA